MNFQQYQFKFKTWSKRLAIAFLCIGAIWSLTNFLNVIKAKSISSLSPEAFNQLSAKFDATSKPVVILEAFAKRALDSNPPEIDASERATQQILARGRPCLNCQNRLVFIDIIRNDDLTSSGLSALSRSFQLSPYGDAKLMKWRLTIASKYWNQLDDHLRKSALSQITALAQNGASRQWLSQFNTDIVDIKKRIERLEIDK